ADVEAIVLRGEERPFGQRTSRRDAGGARRLVSGKIPGALSRGGVDAFVQGGNVDHADHAAALALQPDERAVQRYAANERLGAVNRVQNPAVAALALRFAE